MGWLEILPLLKRLLPLLSRVAPMLETVLATRMAGSGNADALEKIAGSLDEKLAVQARLNANLNVDVKAALSEQTEKLRLLHEDVLQLHRADAEHEARLEAVEQQLNAMARTGRNFAYAILLALIVCATLLLAIFLRH